MDEEVKKVYFAVLKDLKNVEVEESRDGTLLWFFTEDRMYAWSEGELDIVAVFEICRTRR